ncbi:hypothetical protein, partial [Mesorhizobium japonicum]|uniref:hypothetical protein n=1 Tax=Mesorhizobium japonicum TaxID=2066070 RepID=UPI003B5A93E7
EDLRLAAVEAQEQISSQSVDGGADAGGLVDGARRAIDRMAAHDATLAPILESLASASFLLSEISGQLAHYLGDLDTDGGRELELIQERRALLATLVRRYGPTLDDVIDP